VSATTTAISCYLHPNCAGRPLSGELSTAISRSYVAIDTPASTAYSCIKRIERASAMLRRLQWCHILCIGIAPVLYAVFRLTSEAHDADRILIDNIITLAVALGAAFLTVFTIITGRKDEAAPTLLRVYRSYMERMLFLWISNAMLLTVIGVLIAHLALYRQVEFVSPMTGELVLNDDNKQPTIIGVVEGERPTRFRMQVGERSVLLREISSSRSLDAIVVTVPTILTHPARVRVAIALQPEPKYGEAK
jgi:hypothetical protein